MPTNPAPPLARRTLRFTSFDDVLTDARRIAAAEAAGTLRQLGTWTPGQCFGHLAGWINFAYDGYPLKVPAFLRLIMRFRKNSILTDPPKPGIRIPRAPNGTYATEPLPTQEGLSRLESATARMLATPPTTPNPLLGPLTHDEWIRFHLRHAELHLSFLVPN